MSAHAQTALSHPEPAADFVATRPRATLVNAFAAPYDNAVATARTCYSSRIVTAADVARDSASCAQRDAIARSTYAAGHHTTLQHATFQFALEGVSRQCLWSFLHAHPFYNSEQVSQRYVAVRASAAAWLPPRLDAAQAARYTATVAAQRACYHALVELLTPQAAAAYFAVFPARRKHAERYRGAVRKRAQEVARYALPVALGAHLYHTVSGLTLHRYRRLCAAGDVPTETRAVVDAMVRAVDAHDPLFFRDAEDPLALAATHEHAVLAALRQPPLDTARARAHRTAFDAALGPRVAQLVDYSARGEATLARAVRNVLALDAATLPDAEALTRVLSPAHNAYLAGALDLTGQGKLCRTMAHVHYTFQKRLSHAADSQEQRHRMLPGSRPLLQAHYVGGEPDVVVPTLMRAVPAAEARFRACMAATWASIDALLDAGVAAEDALYLLPNAYPVRFYASGDLAGWHHKWTARLCFNAQEEIWAATVQEVEAVRAVHPTIGAHLAPPCGLRRAAGVRPLCPEGTRYCGVPVWKQDVTEYRRLI